MQSKFRKKNFLNSGRKPVSFFGKGEIILALVKTGYANAIQGTTKTKIGVDANGLIVPPESGLAVGTKTFTLSKVSSDNSLEDNLAVISFFMNLVNGSYDELSNTMEVKWEVER